MCPVCLHSPQALGFLVPSAGPGTFLFMDPENRSSTGPAPRPRPLSDYLQKKRFSFLLHNPKLGLNLSINGFDPQRDLSILA